MKFNFEKYKILHLGVENDHEIFSLNGSNLLKVNQEKDLGLIVTADLKSSKHCSEVVKKANKLVGFIGRPFEFKTDNVILSPTYRKDIEKLERVQGRFTKSFN